MKETFDEYLQRLKDRRTEDDYKYSDEEFNDYIYHILDCYEKNISVYKCLEFMYFMKREPIQELGILEVPMPVYKKESLPQELPIVNGSYGCTIQTKRQETLEELVDKLSNKKAKELDIFLQGVKWQQKQDKNKYSEEEVELIANEMMNWALDNIGNQNVNSGAKFDEVLNKFKNK